MKKYLPLLVVAALIFGIVGAFAMGDKPDHKIDSSTALKPSAQIPQYAAGIKSMLEKRFFIKNKFDPEDIASKLNFSAPNNPLYDAASKFTVFSPGDSYISPDQFDALEKDSRFYFTLGNSIKNAGTELPDLLMVIANPKRDMCGEINKGVLGNDGTIPKLSTIVNLTPNNKPALPEQIITLPEYSSACYEGSDGNLYYIQLLIRG